MRKNIAKIGKTKHPGFLLVVGEIQLGKTELALDCLAGELQQPETNLTNSVTFPSRENSPGYPIGEVFVVGIHVPGPAATAD